MGVTKGKEVRGTGCKELDERMKKKKMKRRNGREGRRKEGGVKGKEVLTLISSFLGQHSRGLNTIVFMIVYR